MKTILTFIIGVLLGVIFGSANYYSGVNAGLSWNRGGIEVKGRVGVFLCSASYDMRTQTSTHYKIPQFLTPLTVDC